MLVEKFQDDCLVHGHFWCVNGMIFAISKSPYCHKPSILLCSREYMVWMNMLVEEFQDGCFVLGYLWYANGMILAISESPRYRKERLPSSFCSKEYIVWKKLLVEEFQDGSLVHGHRWCVNEMILANSEYPYCWKPLIKFPLKKIYGFEDFVWRIPRWLFSAYASLMCE